jgi:hypothetical protein
MSGKLSDDERCEPRLQIVRQDEKARRNKRKAAQPRDQGIRRDERGQEQPADRERAQKNL